MAPGGMAVADYPRSRGDDTQSAVLLRAVIGLSPLARGRRALQGVDVLLVRTIPARAGTTDSRTRTASKSPDYPRSRGDDRSSSSLPTPSGGLSPLARGRRSGRTDVGLHPGTIPARAGTTESLRPPRALPGDYPRSRGDDFSGADSEPTACGLSPLARGRHDRASSAPEVGRTIPARAGTTRCPAGRAGCIRDYPRSRGDDPERVDQGIVDRGLSPLARGRRLA